MKFHEMASSGTDHTPMWRS